MPVETAVGEFIVEDDTTCAAGDNEMLFAFANTLFVGTGGRGRREWGKLFGSRCMGWNTMCL